MAVVVSGGTAPYTYVWKKGGSVIAGKNTASVSIATAAAAGDAASYTCEVTDTASSTITSVACVVTVSP